MPRPLFASRPALAVLLLLGALLVLGAAPALASGLGLSILDVHRTIDAQGTSYCPGCGDMGEDVYYSYGDTKSDDQPGVFDDYVVSIGSSADQTSMVGSDALSGQGSIGLGGTGDNSAYSALTVDFQVSDSGTWGLFGDFDVYGWVDSNYIEITHAGGQVFRHDAYGPESFQEFFPLLAGTTYTLRAEVLGYDYSGTSNGGSWSFTLVPEPGTGLLVGAGLLLLSGFGRSTRNHSNSFSTS